MKFTLRKNEVLRSQTIISGLFQPGFFVNSFPLRINYRLSPALPETAQVQVLFSVSKRRFKNATDRNRVKRLQREVYRLNKHKLLELPLFSSQSMVLAIIYTGQQLPEFKELTASFLRCVKKMGEQTHE